MTDDVFGDEDADGVSGAVPVNLSDVVDDRGGDLVAMSDTSPCIYPAQVGVPQK